MGIKQYLVNALSQLNKAYPTSDCTLFHPIELEQNNIQFLIEVAITKGAMSLSACSDHHINNELDSIANTIVNDCNHTLVDKIKSDLGDVIKNEGKTQAEVHLLNTLSSAYFSSIEDYAKYNTELKLKWDLSQKLGSSISKTQSLLSSQSPEFKQHLESLREQATNNKAMNRDASLTLSGRSGYSMTKLAERIMLDYDKPLQPKKNVSSLGM